MTDMEQTTTQQPPVFNNPNTSVNQQPRPMLSFGAAVKTCLSKFINFKGRARRSEYWWYFLFATCVSWVFSMAGSKIPLLSIVGMLVGTVLTIPQLSALTRRLHDTGHSGWWVAIYTLLYIVVFACFGILMGPLLSNMSESMDMNQFAEQVVNAVANHPGISGTMIICALLVLIITIITLIFSLRDSQRQTNRYGASPKYGN